MDATPHESWFRAFSCRVAAAVGTHAAFLIALAVVLGWAISGPVFGFSDSWQLVINTGTTIVTFLMVFLIQATQNRDGKAIQLKLDELIRANTAARNSLMSLEEKSEPEVEEIKSAFVELASTGEPSGEGRAP